VVPFEVPQGATARGLAPELESAGLVSSAEGFEWYLRLTKEGGCIKAGRFELRPEMSAGELVETLCGVPLEKSEPFTVVEGWRIREIDAALAAKGWIQAGEYTVLAQDPGRFTVGFALPAQTLEGYLYPETYMVNPEKWDTEAFVQRQLDTLESQFVEPHRSEIASAGRSLGDLVIMASLLEREEPTEANRPLVAGILWKRIDNNWNLGVDATSRYTLDVWNDRSAFLKKLRDPNDVYNTRLRPGLPPTPIGSPSASALEAALGPEASEYWYYLHDHQQNIHPAKDARGHEANRRKYDVY